MSEACRINGLRESPRGMGLKELRSGVVSRGRTIWFGTIVRANQITGDGILAGRHHPNVALAREDVDRHPCSRPAQRDVDPGIADGEAAQDHLVEEGG